MSKKIVELRNKIAEAWTLSTAVKLNLFENIGGGVSSEDLADKLKFDKTALESLLNALVVSGYLERSDNRYIMPKITSKYLVKNSENYIGEIVNLFEVYDRFQHYDKRLKGEILEPTPKIWDLITDATSRIAKPAIETLIEYCPRIKFGRLSIVDVGCGDGTYLNLLADYNEEAELLGIEKYDNIVNKAVANNRYGRRIKIVKEDFLDSNIKNADLVMFHNLFHIIGDNLAFQMLEKAYTSLNDSGKVCVLEPYYNGKYPAGFHAFFDMNMRLSHKDGKCFGKDELLGMIAKAGFGRANFVELKVDTPNIAYFIGDKQ